MPSLWTLAFLIVSLFVEHTSADSGDDFYNNLFSDLTPILALFGERVTMQFMSQAMGLADCIVLAMAPLGIITAIVSAIRVGGPTWLKAIIGRATENLSAAELELMSSTSKEVCELWNGDNVVRCQGSPSIWEFICLVPDDLDLRSDEIAYGVKATTLEEARNEGLIKEKKRWKIGWWWDVYLLLNTIISWINLVRIRRSKILRMNYQDKMARQEPKKKPMINIIGNADPAAPNISLNRHNTFARREIYLLAAFGTILQLGILLYFGFITYYQAIKSDFLKNKRPIAGYATPMAIGGTVMVVLGVLICAHVVESSTTETFYTPGNGQKAYIIWLQQGSTVSDQVFKSFAIYPKEERAIITISRRAQRDRNKQASSKNGYLITGLEIKTLLGTALGIVGFIIQFVGLRGMHWSASIAQLGGILLMTVLRSWLRRGLANELGSEELLSELEIDWLALQLGKANQALCFPKSKSKEKKSIREDDIGTWTVDTDWQNMYQELEFVSPDDNLSEKEPNGNFQSPRDMGSMAHNILMIRNDLGRISEWRGATSEVAIRVAKTIETIMNVLFLDPPLSKKAIWSLNVKYGQNPSQKAFFELNFRKVETEDGSDTGEAWRAYADEIDSALSLWVYSFRSRQHEDKKKTEDAQNLGARDSWLRGKGPRQELGHRLFPLRCDLDFQLWRPGGLSGISRSREFEQMKKHRKNWGIVGSDPDLPALAIPSHDSLEELYAKHILFVFMCSAAKALRSPAFKFIVKDKQRKMDEIPGNSSIMDWNEEIVELAKVFENNGFGSLSEAYVSIILALSEAKKLTYPFPATSNAVYSIAKEQEKRQDWEKASEIYLFLLEEASLHCDSLDNSLLKAILLSMGHLSRVLIDLERRRELDHDTMRVEKLERMVEDLDNRLTLATKHFSNLPALLTHYKLLFIPYREQAIDGRLKKLGLGLDVAPDHLAVLSMTRLHFQAKEGTAIQGTIQPQDMNERDTAGWTPLHYAAISGHMAIGKFLGDGVDVNVRDVCERTPLHYASWCGHSDFVRLLIDKGATPDAEDHGGALPLHFASFKGHINIVIILLHESNKRSYAAKGLHEFSTWQSEAQEHQDNNGRLPSQWAEIEGHREVVDLMWADTEFRFQGSSPLHLATINQDYDTMKILLSRGAPVNYRDYNEDTPWLIAMEKEDKTAACLLHDNGADVNALNIWGWNPLHKAASDGRFEDVLFLFDQGVNPSLKTSWPSTPLHLAVSKNNKPCVEALLAMGANPLALDRNGETPLMLAKKSGYEEIQKLLEGDMFLHAMPNK